MRTQVSLGFLRLPSPAGSLLLLLLIFRSESRLPVFFARAKDHRVRVSSGRSGLGSPVTELVYPAADFLQRGKLMKEEKGGLAGSSAWHTFFATPRVVFIFVFVFAAVADAVVADAGAVVIVIIITVI